MNCWRRTPLPLGEFISYTKAMSYQSALKIFNQEVGKDFWEIVSIDKHGMRGTVLEWRPVSNVRILTMDELRCIMIKG